MTFAVLPFIVCLLVLLILWIVVEALLHWWKPTPPVSPNIWIIVRAVFAILVILCILHALGVLQAPVSLT